MTPPVLLVPLRVEAAAVRRGAPGARVVRIGMGPARATGATERLLAGEPAGTPFVLLGVGGGLVAGLAPGDVVVASSVMHAGGRPPVELAHGAGLVAHLRTRGITASLEPILSSERIVSGAEHRARAAALGARVVDMEAHWCGPLAERHPFVVCRVLLDVPERELFSPKMAGVLRASWRSLANVAGAVSSWSPTSLDTQPLLEVGDS